MCVSRGSNSLRNASITRRLLAGLCCLALSLFWLLLRKTGWTVDRQSALPRPQPTSDSNSPNAPKRSVNLVVASLQNDDTDWTSKIRIPNLNIIRYVSDSEEAPHRPPIPRRGREALIYHSYFHDFYDDLPDISIMVHADERPWHLDAALNQSLSFALSQMDLDEVERRQYVNLRVDWYGGCPGWINFTTPAEEVVAKEQPFMRQAYQENFLVPESKVPEILGASCCSQFALTKDAIRRNPKEQYKRHVDWLSQTTLSDSIAGRTWEHMWHMLFLGTAIDCPRPFVTYCRLYRELASLLLEKANHLRLIDVCFPEAQIADNVNELWRHRHALMEATEFWREIVNPQAGAKARKTIKAIEEYVEAEIQGALERGRNDTLRAITITREHEGE